MTAIYIIHLLNRSSGDSHRLRAYGSEESARAYVEFATAEADSALALIDGPDPAAADSAADAFEHRHGFSAFDAEDLAVSALPFYP